MEKREFRAESKRILDLMINSIYTHNEIFLRELISNASDASDKLYYNALKNGNTGLDRNSLSIDIKLNKDDRMLVISDKGCGMTIDELENNLGTIAHSGSLNFKKENEKKDDIEIIGQFGVGFYSAFMVAKNVKVVSKAFGSEKAYCWESQGADGYTVFECEKDDSGTEVTLFLKDNTEDENYDEYLDDYKIKSIIKKYSDYIRYPIKMDVERSRKIEDKEEYETYIENETLNSMVPIWRKSSSQLTEEDYNNFYMEKFYDFEKPLKVIHSSVEGNATYNMMLFIPSKAPYNYYTKEYEKGLQLYSNGVLIMEKCADLLPDYFSFVKGLVDSQDLSLNISREMLQHDRQLKIISTNLEKKIKSELLSMLKNDRENYESFFKNFGLQIKFGLYHNYGMNKEALQDLVMFNSSSQNKLVSLEEYVSRMKEEQKYIYYASGESIAKIEQLPQIELLKDKDYEVLFLTDDVDEFAIKMLMKYKEKEFKSISEGDLGLETEEEKKEIAKKSEDNKDLFTLMKDALKDKVMEVRLSTRLKTHPVCLSTEGGISIEMEKVLSQMPNDQNVKAQKVLEINASHPIFNKLVSMMDTDKEKLENYAKILYTQALLIEGLSIEDPVEFSNAVCELMV
jgi:molecular chaperone HtpG